MRAVCLCALFFTASCSTSVQYRIIKFDKTPENTSAFRECQRTFAVATGYDSYGFENLKIRCLSTLDATTSYYLNDYPPSVIDGCSNVESAGYTKYYMCPIK